MLSLSPEEINQIDRNHVWHPYTSMMLPPASHDDYLPIVSSANGCELTLMTNSKSNNIKVIDGMSSWWACIHGYNHPILNDAAINQLNNMSHVMFGGLTHEPAAALAKELIDVLPQPPRSVDSTRRLDKIFFCDSGSVSIEVAMKMALQYWYNVLLRDDVYSSSSNQERLMNAISLN